MYNLCMQFEFVKDYHSIKLVICFHQLKGGFKTQFSLNLKQGHMALLPICGAHIDRICLSKGRKQSAFFSFPSWLEILKIAGAYAPSAPAHLKYDLIQSIKRKPELLGTMVVDNHL